tara:strand:- start:633 stop:1835 length:1203 start_codon:yes stop_codon:yes gene_type:complete
MDFDILDVINDATKEADAFEGHPAADFTMEEQLLYLNGLALVMNADGHIDDSEKEYIRILIKSMSLDESILDDMVTFAKAPDKDTVQAFFRIFRRRPVAQLFLFDALMMTRRDGKVEDKEKAVVDKIADQLEILKGTQQDIFDLFCHIKNRNWQESALYFSSHLLNPDHFKHLLAYHEVEFDALMAETKMIRAKRLLQVMSEKMPSAKVGENIKPTLDQEIIIPLLQAELDRGNAIVVNEILTLYNYEEKKIKLSDIGLTWCKESLALYSKVNTEIRNNFITALLIENLGDQIEMAEAIEILYGKEIVRMSVSGSSVTAISHDISIDDMMINVCLVNEDLWIFRVSKEQMYSSTPITKYNWVVSGNSVGTDINVRKFAYQRCTLVPCTWEEIFLNGLKVQ